MKSFTFTTGSTVHQSFTTLKLLGFVTIVLLGFVLIHITIGLGYFRVNQATSAFQDLNTLGEKKRKKRPFSTWRRTNLLMKGW